VRHRRQARRAGMGQTASRSLRCLNKTLFLFMFLFPFLFLLAFLCAAGAPVLKSSMKPLNSSFMAICPIPSGFSSFTWGAAAAAQPGSPDSAEGPGSRKPNGPPGPQGVSARCKVNLVPPLFVLYGGSTNEMVSA
jgi:hypothetical protein